MFVIQKNRIHNASTRGSFASAQRRLAIFVITVVILVVKATPASNAQETLPIEIQGRDEHQVWNQIIRGLKHQPLSDEKWRNARHLKRASVWWKTNRLELALNELAEAEHAGETTNESIRENVSFLKDKVNSQLRQRLPNDKDSKLSYLVRAYFELSVGDIVSAQNSLALCSSLREREPLYIFVLASLFSKQGKYSEALACYRECGNKCFALDDFIGNENCARKIAGLPSNEPDIGWTKNLEANNNKALNLVESILEEKFEEPTAIPAEMNMLLKYSGPHECYKFSAHLNQTQTSVQRQEVRKILDKAGRYMASDESFALYGCNFVADTLSKIDIVDSHVESGCGRLDGPELAVSEKMNNLVDEGKLGEAWAYVSSAKIMSSAKYLFQARVRISQNRYEEAHKLAAMAINQTPGKFNYPFVHWLADYQKAEAQELSNDGNYASVIKILADIPNRGDLYLLRGKAELVSGNRKEAAMDFRRARDLYLDKGELANLDVAESYLEISTSTRLIDQTCAEANGDNTLILRH